MKLYLSFFHRRAITNRLLLAVVSSCVPPCFYTISQSARSYDAFFLLRHIGHTSFTLSRSIFFFRVVFKFISSSATSRVERRALRVHPEKSTSRSVPSLPSPPSGNSKWQVMITTQLPRQLLRRSLLSLPPQEKMGPRTKTQGERVRWTRRE